MTCAVRRGYVDSAWGQLHYRTCGDGAAPPLVCLHATAYSGRTFVPLMPALATGRRVVAIDTPGYGESDGPDVEVDFADYAEVVLAALRTLFDDAPFDVLGYHTGALVALGMAAVDAVRVRRLVLIGIPFFEGDDRAAWRDRLVHRSTLTEDLAQFAARWDYLITQRTPGLSLARAFDCFVDELKVYPREWWAHAALFDEPVASRLARVAQRTLVLNPTSALAPYSRRAAAAMPDARVVELPALSGAIFDLGIDALVAEIDPFLDEVH